MNFCARILNPWSTFASIPSTFRQLFLRISSTFVKVPLDFHRISLISHGLLIGFRKLLLRFSWNSDSISLNFSSSWHNLCSAKGCELGNGGFAKGCELRMVVLPRGVNSEYQALGTHDPVLSPCFSSDLPMISLAFP